MRSDHRSELATKDYPLRCTVVTSTAKYRTVRLKLKLCHCICSEMNIFLHEATPTTCLWAPCAEHGLPLTQVNTPISLFLDATHRSQRWVRAKERDTPQHQSRCLSQLCPKWKHGWQARERRRDAQAENLDDLRRSRSGERELETHEQERAEQRRWRLSQHNRQLRTGARDNQEQRRWP